VNPYLSVQVQHATQEVEDFLDLARPIWLKWMDFTPSGIEALRLYKAKVTGCHIVGRVVERPGWGWREQHAETLRLWAELGDLVDYWELPNEPAKSVEDVRTLSDWTCHTIANAPVGFKGVIGNFAEGNPAGTKDDPWGLRAWEQFYPAMRLAKRFGWLLGVHEYDAPRMDSTASKAPDETITQHWRCGRLLEVWQRWTEDLQDIGIVIGELGIDRGVDHHEDGHTPTPKSGWRDVTTEEDYLAQLEWYAGLYRGPGPRVVAEFVFLLGATPGGGWERFDITGCQQIAEWLGQQRAALPAGPPDAADHGGRQVKLSEQYQAEYQEWVAAGGVENNLRAHLLAIGSLKPTKEDVPILAGQVKAATEQLAAVVAQLPLG
jgi:hypothetical protein